MQRLIIVITAAVCVTAASLFGKDLLAMVFGVVPGLVFFIISFAAAGGIAQARLPQFKSAQRPEEPVPAADPDSGIGIGLVAAGISLWASGNTHFPAGFRMFYDACAAAGLSIALYQAWKGRTNPTL